ncbi:hypothetical protein CTS44_26053 [Comamonas thiooxydans]|uniref:Uncharacterized protein n=1 Tax=Comamonas testosteroni TaxID=285 RepID=A0A8B4S1Z5_COMTE|nr:hypothetical protein CTS44_26053 [Comamonas thiooxydans]SUY77807.1 Uncharacterised protein [Comamonas testosteroni]
MVVMYFNALADLSDFGCAMPSGTGGGHPRAYVKA